ncbi:MAG TPA: GYF domain-containing protein [Chthoniobacterales bacterium]|nr:GYF domain-containing protein [Chthoniobacterales bacterium]
MQIFVGKNGQQLGPFSLEEINRKLADGTFAGTDLGWYEGAAGWAALSSIAGVIVPAAPAPVFPPAPAPAPAPVSAAPAPAPAPVRSNAPIVQRPSGGYKTLSLVSWILLGLTFFISFIPFLGCGTWILAWPVAVAAIIMGIIMMTRGGTGQGILIILAGVLIVPLTFLGQFASLALFGGTVDRQQQNQVLGNLRAIESAKSQYVAQTNAAVGAPVTMANLTSYLTGREIKPAVEEQYDPKPVGLVPVATIPIGKTLGKFKGGDVVNAANIEKSLASSSAFTWVFNQTSPAPSVVPASSPQPTVASSPTTATSATPSARPSPSPSLSPSPRPTTSPRSLISPRQSTGPDEPSSSARPSPSAKFAPRDGPRMGPRETPSEPDQSGGLKQGRQFPRESPSASPDEEEE